MTWSKRDWGWAWTWVGWYIVALWSLWIVNLWNVPFTIQTCSVNPRGFLYLCYLQVPTPISAGIHTCACGCGFHVGAGAGKGQFTHGWPVMCTTIKAEVHIRVGVRIVCCCYSSSKAGCWRGRVVVRAYESGTWGLAQWLLSGGHLCPWWMVWGHWYAMDIVLQAEWGHAGGDHRNGWTSGWEDDGFVVVCVLPVLWVLQDACVDILLLFNGLVDHVVVIAFV